MAKKAKPVSRQKAAISRKDRQKISNQKTEDLASKVEDSSDEYLTTNQGVRINDNQNSLKSGERGSTLLEDFILREKITHFDHERIPERIVHARGSAAHGVFKLYKSIANLTKAQVFTDTKTETPVFVRFSTVAGSRGSTDLARDVRGFAVKFYTAQLKNLLIMELQRMLPQENMNRPALNNR